MKTLALNGNPLDLKGTQRKKSWHPLQICQNQQSLHKAFVQNKLVEGGIYPFATSKFKNKFFKVEGRFYYIYYFYQIDLIYLLNIFERQFDSNIQHSIFDDWYLKFSEGSRSSYRQSSRGNARKSFPKYCTMVCIMELGFVVYFANQHI